MPEELRILHIYYGSVRHQSLTYGAVGLLLIILGAIVAWKSQRNRRALAITLICFGILSLPFSFVGFFGFRHLEHGRVYWVTENPGSLCTIEAFQLSPRSVDLTPQIAFFLSISALGLLVGSWSRHHGSPRLEGVAFATAIVFFLLTITEIPTRAAALRYRADLLAMGCHTPIEK